MSRTGWGAASIVVGVVAVGSSLGGCASLLTEGSAAGAGVVGAAAAGAVTKNASTTAAIGLGVNAVALAGVKALEKRVHLSEQEAIAATAGPLALGATAPWSIHHRLALEPDEGGELTISRLIRAGSLDCKEVVFSVDAKARSTVRRAFYTTTVCRDGAVWRWAAAEPATPRWGALQ